MSGERRTDAAPAFLALLDEVDPAWLSSEQVAAAKRLHAAMTDPRRLKAGEVPGER